MKTRLNPDTGIREFGPDEHQERKGWLPWIEVVQPVYNSLTQYVIQGDPVVDVDKVTQTWVVIDKSESQIDIDTENIALQAKLVLFKQSAIWTKIKADQDLTNAEIQQVMRFVTRYLVKMIES